MIRQTLALSIAMAMLSACGGGSGSVTQPTPPTPTPPDPDPVPTEVPEITGARAISGSLVQPGESTFGRYLKNGIFAQTSGIQRLENGVPSAPVNDATGDSGGFSQTNTAEAGVDEADRVEYDGEYMYLATQPIWNGEEVPAAAVRIMQRADDFSLAEINSLEVGEANANVNGMYLYEDTLSVLSSGFPFMSLPEIAATSVFVPDGGFTNTVDLQIFDTSTPAQASMSTDISIDGWLVASRRIDNYVYVVSSYNPYVELPHPYPEDEEQRLENYQFLYTLDVEELMPTISVNDVVSQMNQPEDCFIPEQADETDGYYQLLTVTKINVEQSDDISSVCLGAYADTSYMSTESMYLTAYSETGTILHKIDVADSFTYAASGEVQGQVRSDNLRMSEAQGYFRIVTTQWDFTGEEGPTHRLFVLQQDGNDLQTVAQIPNDNQPAAIGKPGEDIFAVRFIQDKAYVVTFERIDPLYVIDLTDNTAPFIAGELEIPGFSSYLHPMDNGYLLGVGQDVRLQDIPSTGGVVQTFPVTSGVKISLFDVSDPANPQEVSNVSFDDTYTPVEYDYRALSVLKTGDQYQFAMPLEGYSIMDDIWMPQNSLLMFNVNATSGAGEMTIVNQMQTETDAETYVWSGEDRSVIHGENVFYVHGNQVWQSLWQEEAAVNGPF